MLEAGKGSAKPKERGSILDSWLENRLAVYAATAGAAGVSMMALAAQAKADIVYTPADIRIPQHGSGVYVDLNHDGITDFYMWIWSYADFGPTYISLFLYARNRGDGAEGAGRGFAARLGSGAQIGSSQKFAPAHRNFGIPLVDLKVEYTSGGAKTSFCAGPWAQKQKNSYLGVKFAISGENHYGWIRLTTAACIGGGRLEATIMGYAYNSVPDQPILAGQENAVPGAAAMKSGSGTLGELALGSLGLNLWRREDQTTEGNCSTL
jgi:hypothetical protein